MEEGELEQGWLGGKNWWRDQSKCRRNNWRKGWTNGGDKD
ncbi:MAG: hypothetical protein UW69_C0040G0022 [Microgenomates group bacterium GW2011_GWA2_44_7]|nr:MAG: hypothetical protein UW69_C0040G0022 [Microgenomates group bacterium GW2011_GWA2_44_7]